MKQEAYVVGLCLFVLSGFASGETVSLPVTPTHERVVIALWDGDIVISPGSDGTLQVVSDCKPRAGGETELQDGLRSLRANASLPVIVVADEVITIRTYEDDPSCSLELAVPERLDLHTRTNYSGSISVDAWSGRLRAWSANGDVNVSDITGSLSVTAMNGDAKVTIGDAGIDADSAITAANGTLTLVVGNANLPAMRAQARWGDVQTDLDARFTEVVEAGSTWFATEREDTDPVLTLRNLNRDIVIRKSRNAE